MKKEYEATEDELYRNLQSWLVKNKFIDPNKRQYTIGLFQSFLNEVVKEKEPLPEHIKSAIVLLRHINLPQRCDEQNIKTLVDYASKDWND